MVAGSVLQASLTLKLTAIRAAQRMTGTLLGVCLFAGLLVLNPPPPGLVVVVAAAMRDRGGFRPQLRPGAPFHHATRADHLGNRRLRWTMGAGAGTRSRHAPRQRDRDRGLLGLAVGAAGTEVPRMSRLSVSGGRRLRCRRRARAARAARR